MENYLKCFVACPTNNKRNGEHILRTFSEECAEENIWT
jgi:hypothetical protein